MRYWWLLAGALALAQSPDELFRSAFEAQQRGDLERAIGDYRKLLKLQPGIVDARGNLGAALSRAGRFDEAIEEYRTALGQEPSNRGIRLNLALALYKKSDWAGAAEQFTVLHQGDASSAQVATLLGDSLLRLKRYEQAIAVLSPVELSLPGNTDIAFVLGSVLIRAGRYNEGLQRIERVAVRTNSAAAHMLAAETLLRMSEFGKARLSIDAAMRANAELPGLLTVRGMLLEKTGDYSGAAVLLEKALAVNANDFQAHLHLGAIRYVERDLEKARVHISRALELDPASSLAQYEMALVERATGNLGAAAKYLEKVVSENPKWLQPHVELAALYYRLKRPVEGAREREIVDRLSAEEHKQEIDALDPTRRLPSP